jgi:hypothetical protein
MASAVEILKTCERCTRVPFASLYGGEFYTGYLILIKHPENHIANPEIVRHLSSSARRERIGIYGNLSESLGSPYLNVVALMLYLGLQQQGCLNNSNQCGTCPNRQPLIDLSQQR